VLASIFGLSADDWQAIAALVGVPAVVASLLILANQVRHEVLAEGATVYQDINRMMMDIDMLFVDRPELRQYFYRGIPITPDDAEYERVAAVSELFVDFMDNFVQQEARMRKQPTAYWHQYFHAMLESSPAIREFWTSNGHWYAPELIELLGPCSGDEAASSFRPTTPQPPLKRVTDPESTIPEQPTPEPRAAGGSPVGSRDEFNAH
jgi:hypothetical protein